MKMHAEVDSNVKTLILEQLGDYLDYLYSIFDTDRAIIETSISITGGTETVTMPTDLLRLDSMTYDNPYQGFSLNILGPKQYNIAQSSSQNTNATPPWGVYPDYQARAYKFVPIPTADLTGVQMYYPQYADISASTDLQHFPIIRLLVLFCYLAYVNYNRVQPIPDYLQEFKLLMDQHGFKYRSKIAVPTKDERFYKNIGGGWD